MESLLWIVVGGLVGWVSTLLAREETEKRIFLSICTGTVGAFVGGLAWGLFVSSDVSPSSLAVSFIGALIAVAAVRLSQRDSNR
jgi:uncharacterized membrane protein YeaQ/YmgE (transglycosylase-associated protein family)